MSILDRANEASLAEKVALQMVNQAQQTFHQMVESFNDGTALFWRNPYGLKPSEIASYLGKDAAEIFKLHYALGAFILKIKPEAISQSLAIIGKFIINDDGTVTIIENDNLPPVTPQNFNASLARED